MTKILHVWYQQIKFIMDWYEMNILMDTHGYNKINYILNTHRLIDEHADEINCI